MTALQQSFIRIKHKPHPSPKPVMVRELPESERPVNRLHSHGPASLSTLEIIATIIQTPTALDMASRIIAKFGSLIGLAQASLPELQEIEGIGPAQAAKLKAAMEFGRRMLLTHPYDRPRIKTPADAANLLMGDMSQLHQEHFNVLCLNSKNDLIENTTLYVGSLNSSVVRVGEIFAPAIKCHAAAIIVAHNHPSGAPRSA